MLLGHAVNRLASDSGPKLKLRRAMQPRSEPGSLQFSPRYHDHQTAPRGPGLTELFTCHLATLPWQLPLYFRNYHFIDMHASAGRFSACRERAFSCWQTL
jgi:hypothetical protein